jgi:lipid-binding SYLF domain-containing protein
MKDRMRETFMKRFMQFAVLTIMVATLGCAHSGATKADVKTAQDEAAAAAEKKDEAAKEQDRQKILAMKDLTLADLYKLKPDAKEVIEKAEGYAVFDATGVFVVLYVGIAGRGVLIDNSNNEATYMTMARAGTGPGIGYHKFRSIIVFKNKTLLDTFKTVGGDIGASGHLVVKGFGKGGGVGGEMSFDPMLSVYQITDHGLAAEASWGGTVFAPDPLLNPKKPSPEPVAQPEKPADKPTELPAEKGTK